MNRHALRLLTLSLTLFVLGPTAGCVRGDGHARGRTVHVVEQPAPRGRAVGHQAGHPGRGNNGNNGRGNGNNGRGNGNGRR